MFKLCSNDDAHDAGIALARIYRVLANRGRAMVVSEAAYTNTADEDETSEVVKMEADERTKPSAFCRSE